MSKENRRKNSSATHGSLGFNDNSSNSNNDKSNANITTSSSAAAGSMPMPDDLEVTKTDMEKQLEEMTKVLKNYTMFNLPPRPSSSFAKSNVAQPNTQMDLKALDKKCEDRNNILANKLQYMDNKFDKQFTDIMQVSKATVGRFDHISKDIKVRMVILEHENKAVKQENETLKKNLQNMADQILALVKVTKVLQKEIECLKGVRELEKSFGKLSLRCDSVKTDATQSDNESENTFGTMNTMLEKDVDIVEEQTEKDLAVTEEKNVTEEGEQKDKKEDGEKEKTPE